VHQTKPQSLSHGNAADSLLQQRLTPTAFTTHISDLVAGLPCYAVRVRTRCEDAVANNLRGKDYEVLTPSYIAQRRYSDRIRKVPCALFPGYVFVRMEAANMLPLVTTPGVSYVLGTGSRLSPLSDEETRTIEALCRMDADQSKACLPCAYLRVGQRVRIEVGPLAGLEGVLVRVRNIQRVVVTVESLRSSVSIEVGHSDIRVLDALSDALPSNAFGKGEYRRSSGKIQPANPA
jgi:transcription antitermination factor NusG